MTNKEWAEAIAEIESVRFQLTHNVMSAAEREEMGRVLRTKLYRLARRDQP